MAFSVFGLRIEGGEWACPLQTRNGARVSWAQARQSALDAIIIPRQEPILLSLKQHVTAASLAPPHQSKLSTRTKKEGWIFCLTPYMFQNACNLNRQQQIRVTDSQDAFIFFLILDTLPHYQSGVPFWAWYTRPSLMRRGKSDGKTILCDSIQLLLPLHSFFLSTIETWHGIKKKEEEKRGKLN